MTARDAQAGPDGSGVTGLHVSYAGQRHTFGPGRSVRIGRGTGSDIVVSDPTVSRQHAVLTWEPEGWVFHGEGRAGTFLGGIPVTRLALREAVELSLGSPEGPVLRLEPVAPPGQRPAGPGPGSRDELASAFQILVPVRSWLTDPGWRRGLRLLVIPYALLPLVFLALFTSSGNLTTPGWAYSLYIAPLWGIAFWLLIRPAGTFGRRELLIALGIVIWVMLWMSAVTINLNNHLSPRSFGGALAVGFSEELTKALPILVAALGLLKLRSVKLDVRMWMFLGTIAGLTFGVREASQYTTIAIEHIAGAALDHSANAAVVGALSFAYRVFVDGFQHAIWAAVAAFFIGMAVNYPRRRVPLIIFGIAIAALLHAVNDWYLSNFSLPWPWIVLQAFSLFLFLGYTMSAASIERNVRLTPLFRGESMIMDRYSETGEMPRT